MKDEYSLAAHRKGRVAKDVSVFNGRAIIPGFFLAADELVMIPGRPGHRSFFL